MDPKYGTLMEGTEEALQEHEQKLGRELVRLTEEEATKARGMSTQERRAYAKKLERERKKKRKAAKAARKRNRK